MAPTAATSVDRQLFAEFEAGTLPAAGFRHRDHVRLAWLYLREQPLLGAIAAFSAALKRFTQRNGVEHRYHETITWAYLCLIHERMARDGRDRPWDDFAAANPDLFDPGDPILRRYYTEETLGSDLARRVFVLPERLRRAPEDPIARNKG
jgi:hypothetical protein